MMCPIKRSLNVNCEVNSLRKLHFLLCILPSYPQKVVAGQETKNEMTTSKSSNLVNPNAREAMNRFKMEAASDVGVLFTYYKLSKHSGKVHYVYIHRQSKYGRCRCTARRNPIFKTFSQSNV